MNTIRATGHDPATAPTLHISSGRGNLDDRPEVHIMMRDTGDETTRVLLGWFPVDELLEAIKGGEEALVNKITIYSKPGCAPCRAAERYLNDRDIPFSKVDVTEDAEAYARITRGGFQMTPVIGYAGSLHTNTDLPDIARQYLKDAA